MGSGNERETGRKDEMKEGQWQWGGEGAQQIDAMREESRWMSKKKAG